MNIFATTDDPMACAFALDDVRVNKMIIESAQLLCTVLRRTRGVDDIRLYREAHINHPCEIWTRNPNNFAWLVQHGLFLYHVKQEYIGGDHSSGHLIEYIHAKYLEGYQDQHTPFRNCTPHKDIADVHTAYRLTMNEKWAADRAVGRHPRWANRRPPIWAEI